MKNKIKTILTLTALLLINQFSFAGATEDLWAALKGANYPNALTAIATGADVKSLDPIFGTPLNFASCWADADVVKALIDAKSEINFVAPSNGYHPLMNAAAWGNIEAVKLLLAAGSDIKIRTKIGQTMLAIAIGSSKLEIVKLLVAAGADPNEKFDFVSFKGWTLMNLVASSGPLTMEPKEKIASIKKTETALSSMSVTFPPRLSNAQESDYTPLEDFAKYLLEKGADANQQVLLPAGSILEQAIGANKIGVVKTLIDNGAKYDIEKEIKITDKENAAALFPGLTYSNGDYVLAAVVSNKIDFVKFMVEKHPKLITKNYEGSGMVEQCASGGNAMSFRYKVEGIDLLMVAAEHGNVEIVKYLIEKGAGKNFKYAEAKWAFGHDKSLFCPFLMLRRTIGFAKNSGKQEIIDLVKAAGHSKD